MSPLLDELLPLLSVLLKLDEDSLITFSVVTDGSKLGGVIVSVAVSLIIG